MNVGKEYWNEYWKMNIGKQILEKGTWKMNDGKEYWKENEMIMGK